MQYYYYDEADTFTFYRIPKLLFINEHYKNLPTDAKLLYGLLLDRMGLSAKREQWIDKEGRVFIYFQQTEAMELLNISGAATIVKLYKALEEVDLLERKKQGFGKPDKLYVGRLTQYPPTKGVEEPETDAEKEEQTFKNQKSRLSKNESKTFKNRKSRPSKNESVPNKTNSSDTESVNQSGDATNSTEQDTKDRPINSQEAKKQIAQQIDWTTLMDQCTDTTQLQTIAAIMQDAISSDAPQEKIGGATRTRAEIRTRLANVNTNDIAEIIAKLRKTPYNGITNLHGYILTCLYNAPISRKAKRREETDEYQEEIRKYAQALKRQRERKKAAKTAE